tara:strand:+ start:86 stop:664 length:579 start_codon:yes stop_codon:yes gene_type:complete
MKIYTKTGDDGSTSLYDGSRVLKTEDVVNALGDVDELASNIGMLCSVIELPDDDDAITDLRTVQSCLQNIGSAIATPKSGIKASLVRGVGELDTKHLEVRIDFMQGWMPPLGEFVLPGCSVANSQAHICRSICRRVERSVGKLSGREVPINADVLVFINRLSDYFFVLARWVAFSLEDQECFYKDFPPHDVK